MPVSDAELERFSHADYWDERYLEAGPGEQVHEWLSSFDDLVPFFNQNLLRIPPAGGRILILHLGSGDSVSGAPPLPQRV